MNKSITWISKRSKVSGITLFMNTEGFLPGIEKQSIVEYIKQAGNFRLKN